MPQLLLELFSEEIPARMQYDAANHLQSEFEKHLQERGVVTKELQTLVTPRRLCLVAEGIPVSIKGSSQERRGPRDGAPEGAIQGFAKSAGVAVEDLQLQDTPKGKFYFAIVNKASEPMHEVLQEVLQDIITHFPWPKSMRWGAHSIRWVRPLHRILCVFNGKVVPVSFGHINAADKTEGHRFLAPAEFTVKDAADYKQQLAKAHVMLDQTERQAFITAEAEKLAAGYGLEVKHDDGLLAEVAGLVESPNALIGKIEPHFMELPEEVLITSLKSHQKYFTLADNGGKLAPYFITVSNVPEAKKGKSEGAITHGNERVLKARLDDARFFWDQDRSQPLAERVKALKNIVFHAKLGSVFDKKERVKELAKLLSVWVPHANLGQVERAAELAKADLVTEMVGEFTDLQGVMGYYYAIESKEDEAVAKAVKDHYRPEGPSDTVPDAPVSIAVALADKVDTMVGLFSVGEKPTGSKDPYALRRAALGVIRIILENGLRVPLKLMFEKSLSKYPTSLIKGKKGLLKRDKSQETTKQKHQRIIDELLQFMADRLKVILKTQDIEHDVIMAAFNDGSEDDLVRLVARTEALSVFLASEDGGNLLGAYRRATNIVVAEEKKDGCSYQVGAKKDLLQQDEERAVFDLFRTMKASIEKSVKSEQYGAAMTKLAELREPIDRFFDAVTVNCEDAAIRKNRLAMLSQFRGILHQIADFGAIDGAK